MTSSRRAFLRTSAAAATAALAGCRHRDLFPSVPVPPATGTTGGASLGAHAAEHNLLYGCAINVPALATNPPYASLIREQCRIVVAENTMKWAALRPSATTFRFDEADAFVAFAEANKQKIRGHNLAWHQNNPAWLASISPAEARDVLVHHIETVTGRYAGRMHSWDVVNEAVLLSDRRPDGLRDSAWLQLIGPEYLELAFQTARNADPQALLTYNDYGIEADDPASEQKRQAVLLLLRRLVTRHIPIDAVGIQSHISALAVPGYGSGLMRFIASVRELGLQVFLTELDVNDRSSPADQRFRDAAVASTYRQYLDLVLTDPAVRAVLTWGITDRYTWLNHEGTRADKQPERCLPFDADNTPAQAFYAMRDCFDRHPA